MTATPNTIQDSGGEPIREIVVVGGGAAAWMTASALARVLVGERRCAIRLVDNGCADTNPGLAVGSLPTLADFHALLGLDEDALLRGARGTFKLGTRFDGWSHRSYFHPFGPSGANLGPVAFQHFVVKLARLGQRIHLEDFSLAALAARAGKFSRPSPDPRSVLSTLAYGLHLETALYVQQLRALAERLGVQRIDGEVSRANLNAEDGRIETVTLTSGERIGGDLFIDCSGQQAVLIGKALRAGFEDWSRWSPFDRIAEIAYRRSAPPEAFTLAEADRTGWRQRTPLQGLAGAAYVYSSAFTGDDDAAAALTSKLDGAPFSEPRLNAIPFGRRKAAWERNCIAIGGAAASLGILESAGPQLVQSGIIRLVGLFPYRDHFQTEAAEYNRLMASETERMRDLTILHCKANQREGDPVWDHCRTVALPESLAYKIELFASRGRVALYDEEVFPASSWVSVLMGQGVWPRRYDPLADGFPLPQLEDTLRRIQAAMGQAVAAMPSHADYIRRCCTASEAAA